VKTPEATVVSVARQDQLINLVAINV